jgi:hypothetical protein
MRINKGKITLLIASIAVGLHGCYEGTEFRPAPVGGWSDAPPRPASRPNAIIDNPDESHQDYDYVWASSEAEAIRECQAVCERDHTIFVKVKRASANSKRYECHWRT